MLLVLDAREKDSNSVSNVFFFSFTLGYAATFFVKILATTLLRLPVLYWFEKDVFPLPPEVPVPILP
jgi:hypothetical protein